MAVLFRHLRSWSADSATVARWRERRYQMFLEACSVRPSDRIVDVGAGYGAALERFNTTNPIVAVDLNPHATEWLSSTNVTVVEGDGTRLPFADNEFDIAFSNSVIEHVPPELQASFAADQPRARGGISCRRPTSSSRSNRTTALFQYLPRSTRR